MKNLKKLFVSCFAILIFAILLLTGCSDFEKSSYDYDNLEIAEYNYENAYEYDVGYTYAAADNIEAYILADADYDRYAYDYNNYAAAEAPAVEAAPAPRVGGGDYFTYLSNLPPERKIIRDANIVMEVESAENSYEKILLNVAIHGGYEANRDMRMGSNNYMVVNATLKIPSNKLDLFLNDIKDVGTVLSSTVSSADITDEYFDSKTRLETLEKILARYYEFLDAAKDVDEQLKVTGYINDVTYEIEKIKGRLQKWDSLVDYSTVTLYLYRPADEPTTEPTTEPVTEPETTTERTVEWSVISADDMGYNIMQGIADTCSAIFRLIQGFITWLITSLPVLIPIGIVLVFVIVWIKKLIRKHKSKKESIDKFDKDKSDKSDDNNDNINIE